MKFQNLFHRHGGRITDIDSIAHEGKSWWVVGRVEWDGGSVSEAAEISPTCLVSDDDAGRAEVNLVCAALMSYLRKQGHWKDRKGDWKPTAKKGSASLHDFMEVAV